MRPPWRPWFAVLVVATLAGCESGSSSQSGSSSLVPAASSRTVGAASAEPQGDVDADELALGRDGPGTRLYVSNAGDDSIDVFRHVAAGNAKPIRRIVGPATEIAAPGQLWEDAAGELYVANGASVLVFAAGADGNVAPIRTLAGSTTTIKTAVPLTVDALDGSLYVYDDASAYVAKSLLHFAPLANGNVAPLASGEPLGFGAYQMTSDSSDRDLIVANAGACCSTLNESVTTYAKAFSSGGQVPVVHQISAIPVMGVVDDPTRQSYLVTTRFGIDRFSESTDGSGPEGPNAPSYTPPMQGAIASDTCGGNLALGRTRNLFVVHSTAAGACAVDAIYVYHHDATGAVQPLRVLSGASTMLDRPVGIFVGS